MEPDRGAIGGRLPTEAVTEDYWSGETITEI